MPAALAGQPGGSSLGELASQLPAEPARVLALPHFDGSGTAENDPLSRGRVRRAFSCDHPR